MFVNESRGGPEGLGYLALQHHNYGLRYDLDQRASCWGIRILDREIGEGQMGHYVHDENSLGDMIGAFHWPSRASSTTGETSGRTTGAWSWVFPAVHNPEGSATTGGPFGAVTPGSRTPTDGPEIIPTTTGPNIYLGNGVWSPGTTTWGILANSPAQVISRGIDPRTGQPILVVTPNPLWGAAGGPGGAPGAGGVAGGPGPGAAAGAGGAAAPGGFQAGNFPNWIQTNPGGAGGPGAGIVGFPVGQLGGGGGIQVGVGLPPGGVFFQGVQADVGLPGNENLFGFFGPPLGIQTQGFGFADTFGIGGPMLFPFFLPGFVPDGGQQGSGLATPTKTASWMSDYGDIDDREEGEVRTNGPIYPLRDEKWEADTRFQPVVSPAPDEYPVFAKGFKGLMVQATEEDRQVTQFHPTDPRLIAPQLYGDPRSGTIVEEPNKDGVLDGSRQAHLQSMMRVVVDPKGIGKEGEDALSWQISKSPRRDVNGGLFTDLVGHGHIGVQGGGPLLSGQPRCKHFIGKDADGVSIRSGHLSTESLFISNSGRDDAPIEFEPVYRDGDDLDFPIRVHLGYDINSRHGWMGGQRPGLWRFWTTSLVSTVPPTITPREPTPPDTPPPGEVPPPTITPGHDTMSSSPVGSVQDISVQDPTLPEGYAHTSASIATPGLYAKPQRVQSGAGNMRSGRMSEPAMREWERTVPLTGRIESYGAQGGTPGGPYFDDYPEPGGWAYTYAPGDGRSPTGSAPGGWVILPPEVGLESVDDDFAPSEVTTSEVTFLAGPGARLGVGSPELATGGVKDGATLEANGSDIRLKRYGSDGSETAETDKDFIDWVEFLTTDGNEITPGEINDVKTVTKQKQMSLRVDGDERKLQFNIGGGITSIGMGACAAFGQIYNNGTSSAQSVTSGSPIQLNQFTTAFGSPRRVTEGADSLTLLDAGLYLLVFNGHIQSDTAATEVEARIRVEGVEVPTALGEAYLQTANSQGPILAFGFHVASANDEVTVYIDADKSVDHLYDHCTLTALMIGQL